MDELQEFLQELQAEINARRLTPTPDDTYPYPEVVFTEIAAGLMYEHDLTGEPEILNFCGRLGNASVRISGYSLDEEGTRLDLYITCYLPEDGIQKISRADIEKMASRCQRFLQGSVSGELLNRIPDVEDAWNLANIIHHGYRSLEQIRIFVLTNALSAGGTGFRPKTFADKLVNLEVVDLRRLCRMSREGRTAEPVNVDFKALCGAPLPCIICSGEDSGYQCLLTSLSGNMLYQLYAQYDARLLEANVRSFLSATGKVNKGIRDTLKNAPEMFMAYNNGIVIIAGECGLCRMDSGQGLLYLKDFQIVNGGQTTASIFFARRKEKELSLDRVHIAAKIIVPRHGQDTARDDLIADISRFANSQNTVKVSDLSANNKYHVDLEKVAGTVYIPDGSGRWFYERASGSYRTMLALQKGAAQQRAVKAAIPSSRRLTKTDVAKFLNTWGQMPHTVSLGTQKNFTAFMTALAEKESREGYTAPTVQTWKKIVALAILCKQLSSAVRKQFSAFQANITTYTIASFARDYGHRMNLMKIWNSQRISGPLMAQLLIRAGEVKKVLEASSRGRMISEWAKKEDCWNAVRKATFSSLCVDVPELQQ